MYVGNIKPVIDASLKFYYSRKQKIYANQEAKMRTVILTVLAGVILSGCAAVPETAEKKDTLHAEVAEAIAVFKSADPEIQRFFDRSYAYAVLPKIFKGAFWLGGAYGKGEVYEQNQLTSYCTMSQATLGFSFGGEFFREIVFFRDREDFDTFRESGYTFAAQATATALTVGAAAKAGYDRGVAVFVASDVGLMVDASLGGQKFSFTPGLASP